MVAWSFNVDSAYSPRSRAERLIATGRVALAACSLHAIWLDSSEPAKYAQITYTFLTVYVAYALLVALIVWHSKTFPAYLRLLTHVLDLAVFSVVMFLTDGPTSPFFVYFVFCLVCATLRWQWRGTLWTAAAALAIFLGMGAYAAEVLHDPAFELNRFIVRGVDLAVVATLLGYLGAHERRLRRELSMLAAWPRPVSRETAALVSDSLEHAAAVLGAPRVLLVWEEEEPWLGLAWWANGEFDRGREAPATWQPLVAEPLAGADFLCPDAGAPVPAVLHASPQASPRRWSGAPLHPDFRARFAVGPVLSAVLRAESLEGRLFWFDKVGMTSDDLVLAAIVARQVAANMDHLYLLRRLQEAAVAEDRVRLARDLHDGLLQSLTAAGLQLETARACLLVERPEMAREKLETSQRLIRAEQRNLRAFIGGLKPATHGSHASLAARLGELAKAVEREWRLPVELQIGRLEARIPEALADHAYLMIREALVNAARHAGASTATVEVDGQDSRMRIVVADDGHGFPFSGRYEHAALAERGLGPVSLRERAASLGGTLAIDSTEKGARLEITLPLPLDPLDGVRSCNHTSL